MTDTLIMTAIDRRDSIAFCLRQLASNPDQGQRRRDVFNVMARSVERQAFAASFIDVCLPIA